VLLAVNVENADHAVTTKSSGYLIRNDLQIHVFLPIPQTGRYANDQWNTESSSDYHNAKLISSEGTTKW